MNCEFELAKSSLINEYDIDYDALTTPTIDTLFNFDPRDVGLAEFNNLGCSSSAVLTTSTIATIITNKNENEMIFGSGSLWDTQTQTQTIHQSLNSNDKIGATGVGLRKFYDVLSDHEFYDVLSDH